MARRSWKTKRHARTAISTAIVAVVAVVIVVALVGGYFALSSSSSKTSSSTSSTSTSTTSSSSSTTSSTSTSSASGSGGYFPFNFDLVNSQYAIVGQNDYTEIIVLQITHGLAAQNETVALTANAPSGVSVTYSPTSPVTLSSSTTLLNVSLIIATTSSAQPGNDTIKITGTSGSQTQSTNVPVQVVKDRVIIQHGEFEPAVVNVTMGTTVYWQNLDGPQLVCGVASPGGGQHSVVFTTIPGANSSTIAQFHSYSYTFNTPGSYFYYSSVDSDHSVNGTINVLTSSGTVGNLTPIPVFSNFSPGSQASILRPTTASVANAKVGGNDLGLHQLDLNLPVADIISLMGLVGIVGSALALTVKGIRSGKQ